MAVVDVIALGDLTDDFACLSLNVSKVLDIIFAEYLNYGGPNLFFSTFVEGYGRRIPLRWPQCRKQWDGCIGDEVPATRGFITLVVAPRTVGLFQCDESNFRGRGS